MGKRFKSSTQPGPERVFIGLGSNIDKQTSILRGVQTIQQMYSDTLISAVYESIPFGFEAENFYNLAMAFVTNEPVETVVENLRQIEIDLGRTEFEKKFSSRILDIDLLMYGNHVIETDTIRVPRDDILQYSFVLKPLSEISPDTIHPVAGKTFKQLWQDFHGNKDDLWKIDMDLSLIDTEKK